MHLVVSESVLNSNSIEAIFHCPDVTSRIAYIRDIKGIISTHASRESEGVYTGCNYRNNKTIRKLSSSDNLIPRRFMICDMKLAL